MNNLRKNLEKLIQHHPGRLTQSRLCKELGLSESVLSGWLKGVKPKNIDDVKKVADFFGTSLDSLVYGDASEKIKKEMVLEDVGEFRVVVQRVRK
jgi:transcriptional regulator with XRE-family HTH domain